MSDGDLKGSLGASKSAGEEPLTVRAVRGGLWVASGSYVNLIVGFAANIFLTRMLGPEVFGIFALGLVIASFLELRSKFGIAQAFGQRTEDDGDLVGTYFWMEVGSAVGGLAVMLIALPILTAIGYGRDVLQVAVVLSAVNILTAGSATASTLLDKSFKARRISIITNVAFVFSYMPALWLAYLGKGYWSLLSQSVSYALLLSAGLWWGVKRDLPEVLRRPWRFRFVVGRQFLKFGMAVGLAYTASLFLTQFDSFLVGTFVGMGALGFYDRALRLAIWPTAILLGVIGRTAFYTYVHLQHDPERLSKAFAMTSWLITLVTLPLSLALFISGPDLIIWLYGDEWLPSALFLRLLIVYAFLRPFLENAGALLTAVGRPKAFAKSVMTECAVLVVGGLILSLTFGAVGTCIAVGIAVLAGAILRIRCAKGSIAVRYRDIFARPVITFGVVTLGYLGFLGYLSRLGWSTPINVVVKVLYAFLGCFACLCLSQPRTTLERARYTRDIILRRGVNGS